MKTLAPALLAAQRSKENSPCAKIEINTFGHAARTGDALAEDEVYGEEILHYDSYTDYYSRFALLDNGNAIIAACRAAPDNLYNNQYYLEKNIVDLSTITEDVETTISETETAWTAVASYVTCSTSAIHTEEGTCSAHIEVGSAQLLTGTVTFTSGSVAVTGSGTSFNTVLVANCYIKPSTGTFWYKVSTVTDATHLTLASACSAADAGVDVINKTEYRYVLASGLLARKTISATDLTGASYIRFFIRLDWPFDYPFMDVGIANCYLRLALDDTTACTSPIAYLDLPHVSRTIWTEVTLQIPDPSLLTSVVSIGLYMVGPGSPSYPPLHIYIEDIKSVVSDWNNWERLNDGAYVSTSPFATGLAAHETEVLIYSLEPAHPTYLAYWRSTDSGVNFGSATTLSQPGTSETYRLADPITAVFNTDGDACVTWGVDYLPIDHYYTYYNIMQRVSGSWLAVKRYPTSQTKWEYADAIPANRFTHYSHLFFYGTNWFLETIRQGGFFYDLCVPLSYPDNAVGFERYFSVNTAYTLASTWSFTDVSQVVPGAEVKYPPLPANFPKVTMEGERKRYGQRYELMLSGGGIDTSVYGIVLVTTSYGVVLYTGTAFFLMTLGQTVDDTENVISQSVYLGDYTYIYWDKGLSSALFNKSVLSAYQYTSSDKDIWQIVGNYISKTSVPAGFLTAVLNGTLETTTAVGEGVTALTITTKYDEVGRLLALQGNDQSAQPYLVILNNEDLTYANPGAGAIANIVKGSQVSIYKGYTVNGVDTYHTEPNSKLFIESFGYARIDRSPVFVMECISGWTVANRTTAQIPIFWNYYDPEETTLYAIIDAIITHLGGTLTYTSRSAEILAMYPKFAIGVGDNLGRALSDLLELVPDQLIFNGLDAKIVYPQETDVANYNYSFEEL